MTKDTTVMLKGYSMNLKMRLSEVYSLPLVKFLTSPTRSVLCTPRMFFLTLEKYSGLKYTQTNDPNLRLKKLGK